MWDVGSRNVDNYLVVGTGDKALGGSGQIPPVCLDMWLICSGILVMKLGGTGMGRANFVVARGVWRNNQLHKGNGGFGWALG